MALRVTIATLLLARVALGIGPQSEATPQVPPPDLTSPQAVEQPAGNEDPANEDLTLKQALTEGSLWVDLNYRFAFIDAQGFSADAYASTLRTALGYETGAWHGLKALLEFENVSNLGNPLYNSTQNGETSRPIEPDPVGTSVNQAYGSYVGVEELDLRVGRQEIALDNHRFIGTVPWRQKHQTFEAGSARGQIGNFDLYYAYAGRVNNVTRRTFRADIHMLNLAHVFEDVGRLTFYGYYLDYKDLPQLSTLSLGVRFNGSLELDEDLDLLYTAEYANQQDIEGNPNPRDADYYFLDLGVRIAPVSIRGSIEVLGGDGATGGAFQTPLATLHKFNGFADRFLVTPNGGLQDASLQIGSPIGDDAKISARFHDFRADSGSMRYGTEFDLVGSYKICPELTLAAKVGSYWSAQDFIATDITTRDVLKAWVWMHLRF